MATKKKVVEETQEQGTRLGEFGSAIMQIAEEKGIPKNVVIETIEAALAAAYKKDYGKRGQRIRAEFQEVGGNTKFFLIFCDPDKLNKRALRFRDHCLPRRII